MEFEFPVMIDKTYPLKKNGVERDDLFVIRFYYLGGRGSLTQNRMCRMNFWKNQKMLRIL